MISRKTITILNSIEKTFPVDKWKIEGVRIWPYMRFLLSSHLVNKPSKRTKMGLIGRAFETYILDSFRFIIYIFLDKKNNQRIENAQYFFLDNGNQISKLDGKYFSIRTDPIISKLKESGIKSIKMEFGRKYKSPRYYPSISIQHKLNTISLLSYIKRKIFKPKYQIELKEFSKFLKYLEKENIKTDKFTPEKIANGMGYMFSYRKYFKRVLRKVNPKVAFSSCYDSTYSFAFQLACHDLGITSVDLQHGVQGELHWAYSKWANVPKSGYEMMSNIFHVWSDIEKETIEKWSKKTEKHRVFVGKSNYVSMWTDPKKKWVKESDRKIKDILGRKKYSKIILYSLGSFEPKNNISDAIKTSPREYFWFIRPHPRKPEFGDIVEHQIKGCKCNYEIEKCIDLPLFGILRFCDSHITSESTVVVEASYFGIKSVVTNRISLSLFKEETKKGFVKFCTKSEDILKTISNVKKVKSNSLGLNYDFDLKKFEKFLSVNSN